MAEKIKNSSMNIAPNGRTPRQEEGLSQTSFQLSTDQPSMYYKQKKNNASQNGKCVRGWPNYWMHVPLLFGHLTWNLIRSNGLIIGLRNSVG